MKVLVLLSRVPYPLEKGDKLRAFHHIRALAQHHRIVLCCLNDQRLHPDALNALKPYCEEIYILPLSRWRIPFNLFKTFFNQKPFQVNYFYQKSLQKQLNAIIEQHLPKHLFVQLIRTAEYVRPYSFIPSTLDYMDAFSTGIARRIQFSIPLVRTLFTLEAQRLKVYEAQVFKFFTHKLIISEQDRALIDHPDKDEIHIVPNGVDLDYFQPQSAPPEYDLVFVGNMGYPPNIRAARFLVKQVLPLLLPEFPDIRILISGAQPPARIRSLHGKHVHVSGWVPDIRTSYANAKIFVAPLEIGTGLQNKLLEAMAMGLPCITSALVNRALGAKPDEEILIGSQPEEYAAHIRTLLQDESRRRNLASAGHTFVRTRYNWDQNSRLILDLAHANGNGTKLD